MMPKHKFLTPIISIKRLWYRVIASIALRQNLIFSSIVVANKPRMSRKNTVKFKGQKIYIGHDCHIGADLVVEDEVLIASSVSFVGGDHRFDLPDISIFDAGREENAQITIRRGSWVGHGSIICGSVCVGEGAIIAAGSVVTKNVTPYTIVGGNPARFIRKRFS